MHDVVPDRLSLELGAATESGARPGASWSAFSVDAFSGITHALRQMAVDVTVSAVRVDGFGLPEFRVAVPNLASTIVLKALSAPFRPKDLTTSAVCRWQLMQRGSISRGGADVTKEVDIARRYLAGAYRRSVHAQVSLAVGHVVPQPPPDPTFRQL